MEIEGFALAPPPQHGNVDWHAPKMVLGIATGCQYHKSYIFTNTLVPTFHKAATKPCLSHIVFLVLYADLRIKNLHCLLE